MFFSIILMKTEQFAIANGQLNMTKLLTKINRQKIMLFFLMQKKFLFFFFFLFHYFPNLSIYNSQKELIEYFVNTFNYRFEKKKKKKCKLLKYYKT